MRIFLFTALPALALTLALLAPTSAAAGNATAPDAADAIALEEVEVVATPIIQGNKVSRYGAEKTVVSQEQVSDLNAGDTISALRTTPGVAISRYNPVGSFGGSEGGGIFIRGFGSSRPGGEIATMIDGVPISQTPWDHPIMDPISVDAASSIEVFKGIHNTEFGNAFGGINLTPFRRTTEGTESAFTAQYGSWSTSSETFRHGGKKGPFDYYFGQSYRFSEGHRENSSGKLANYFARVGVDIRDNWYANIFMDHSDNYADDPGHETTGANKGDRYGTINTLFVFNLEHEYDKASGKLKLYRSFGQGIWDYADGTRTKNENELYGIKAKEALRLWDGGEIALGADLDYAAGTSALNTGGTFNDGPHMRTFSPYLSVSHMFGERDGWFVIPSAGVRHYDHSEFDAQTAPNAGIVAGYKDTELHASYARGVHYPGLFVVLSSELWYGGTDSWKDLEAETVDHYEIGLKHRLCNMLKAEVTAFLDEGENRYNIITTMPRTWDNQESFRTQGLETTLTFTPVPNFSAFAGATFMDTHPSDTPYAPDTSITGGFNWLIKKLVKVSADAQYLGSYNVISQGRTVGATNTETVDGAFLLNAKVAYLFQSDFVRQSLGTVNGEVFLAGENLTDENYEYRPGYPMPGIGASVGVSLKF